MPRNKILAQLVNDSSGEAIRDFYYDLNGETLESVIQKVEKYVMSEKINDSIPVRIKVTYV